MYCSIVAVPGQVMFDWEDRGRKVIYLTYAEHMPVTINEL